LGIGPVALRGRILVLVALMRIGILRYAYLQIGVSSRAAMALFPGSTKKEQGPPALTATQPVTGSPRRQ
jgi:hypothetical protein